MQHVRTIGVSTALAALIAIGATAAVSADNGADHGSATIADPDGATIGFAKLVEDGDGTVHVNIHVAGLSPGLHGVHIHEIGSCASGASTFSGAGSHHRAAGTSHPDHYGDLPNLVVNTAGQGRLQATITSATLSAGASSVFDADGSAIVVHALEDEFDAVKFGGPRVACGVISADRP